MRFRFMPAMSLAFLFLLGAPPPGARADFTNLGPATNYNVFVFGDDTQSGTDAIGRVAVGGNANFGGYTIASGNPTSSVDVPNLVVGGNYSNTYNTVNGRMIVGGNASINGPTINGNMVVNGNLAFSGYGTVNGNVTVAGNYTNPNTTINGAFSKGSQAAMPFSFADAKTYLTKESSYLHGLAQTAGAAVSFSYNNLSLTGPAQAASFVIFHVTADQLANMNDLKINVTPLAGGAAPTVVIDVSGTNDRFHNNGITISGTDKQHVLFNFSEAMTLDTGGIGIQGSLLAPLAAINFNSGSIDGTLIGNSVYGTGESHNFVFQGNLPSVAVPEPASIALLTIGGLGTGLLFRRRLRRQASAPGGEANV